jgi:hypothetical protein
MKIFNAEGKTGGKIDLENNTFIIPIKIDSSDRLDNLSITIDFLSKNFNTNIILLEADEEPKIKEKINQNITYIFYQTKDIFFHRTKFLNIMLNLVKTKCVVNYDVDVLLPINSYKKAYDSIINDEADLVYPFHYGNLQHEISMNGKKAFKENYCFDDLKEKDFSIKNYLSEFGHCQFFNKEEYIANGMENEYFISYGPEDKERFERFNKLDKKIKFIENSPVYHLEHYRGEDSSEKNFYFNQNWNLYQYLKNLNPRQTKEFYDKAEYREKYKNN